MNSLKKNKKFYFRFDAGDLIGFGHMGRVEAISDACKLYNIDPIWVVRNRPNLNKALFKYPVIWLQDGNTISNPNPSTWIMKDEIFEAEELLNVVSDADLIFIDHYCMYKNLPLEIQKKKIKCAAILDYFPEKFNCDFIINYNVGVERELEKYKAHKKDAIFMLGPKYAPIKSGLKRLNTYSTIQNSISNVGIYLGGVKLDTQKKLLNILNSTPFFFDKKMKWCVSSESDLNELKTITTKLSIEFIGRQNNLLEFYSWSELMVGASGVSYLERSYVGILQVLFKVADNQNDVVKYLPDEKMAFYAGDLIHDSESILIEQLNKLSIESLVSFAEKASQVYEGKGPNRILETIMENL